MKQRTIKSNFRSFEKERFFAEKLANVFLSDKNVKVHHGENNIAYCHLKDKKIWFDFDEIFKGKEDGIFRDMMTFKGLAFHEILHLKHTMRSKTTNKKSTDFMALLQRLEDGRIETLGVMEYEKLADYLIYSVNNVLLENRNLVFSKSNNSGEEAINMYILCYGRLIFFQDKKFLTKLRELLLKKYGYEVPEKIEDCIDRYILEPRVKKRIDIAEELYDFLKDNNIFVDFASDMNGKRGFLDATKEEQKNIPGHLKQLMKDFPKLKKLMADIRKELQQKTSDLKEKVSDRKKFVEKKHKEIERLRKERQKRYRDLHSAQSDTDKIVVRTQIWILQAEMENVVSKSYSPLGISKIYQELRDMFDEKYEEQQQLVEDNKFDLKEDLKSIGHSLDDVYADSTFTVTPEMEQMASRLEKGLKKMNNELAKGYIPKQKSGRVNVRKFFNRSNVADTKVFNRWLPDKVKQTKFLVNMFIDGSGSMRGKRWLKAVNSCWVLNKALNRDKNKIMAYQFSTDFQLMKNYDQLFTVPAMIGGGTYPAGAINNAIPKIESYKKANRYNFVVDIIVTDGFFDLNNDSDAIAKLNNLGHETIIIHVEDFKADFHNAKHRIILKSFDLLVPELITIFTKLRKVLIMRARR